MSTIIQPRARRLQPWWIIIGLVVLVVLAWLAVRLFGAERLMPGLAGRADAIAVVQLRRSDDILRLARDDAGNWRIASAADAPANGQDVRDLIDGLASIRVIGAAERGVPVGAPVEVLLRDREGRAIAYAVLAEARVGGVVETVARRAGQSTLLEVEGASLPSVVPGAWTDMQPPRIDPAQVVAVDLIEPGRPLRFVRTGGGFAGPDGRAADVTGLKALLAQLGDLPTDGFAGGDSVNWAGARYIQMTMADGSTIAVQAAAADGGGAWVRFNADVAAGASPDIEQRAAAIKAMKRYAFHVEPAAASLLLRAPSSFVAP